MGIAWRLSGKLLLTIDLEQYGWSNFDQQDIDFSTELKQAGFADISIPYAWENSWVFDMGIELELNGKCAVRAGYSFIQDFIPDQTFSPANPIDDQHAFSIGIGYRAGRGVVIDIFYVIDFFQSREVHNEILSGTYDSICHFSGMSLDYRF